MSQITRWDPYRELEEVQNRLANFFGQPSLLRREHRQGITTAEWAPLVDISEDEESYRVCVELPEVRREDIKVSVENGTLVISGERRHEREEKKKERYHRVERAYGTFVRSFSLPDDVDAEKVHASYKDGVLNVRIPKTERARPRQVEVKTE